MSDRCRIMFMQEAAGVVNRLGNYLISNENSQIFVIDRATRSISQTIDTSSIGLFRYFDADTTHFFRGTTVIEKISRDTFTVESTFNIASYLAQFGTIGSQQVVYNFFVEGLYVYCQVQFTINAAWSMRLLKIDKQAMTIVADTGAISSAIRGVALIDGVLFVGGSDSKRRLSAVDFSYIGDWTTTKGPSPMIFDATGNLWMAIEPFSSCMVGPIDFTEKFYTPYRAPRNPIKPAYHSGDDLILLVGGRFGVGERKFYLYQAAAASAIADYTSADLGVQLSWGVVDSTV